MDVAVPTNIACYNSIMAEPFGPVLESCFDELGSCENDETDVLLCTYETANRAGNTACIDAIAGTGVEIVFPTADPTENPTFDPTFDPTENPTLNPTHTPTEMPTPNPTEMPTENP